jgi:hypothetical protein
MVIHPLGRDNQNAGRFQIRLWQLLARRYLYRSRFATRRGEGGVGTLLQMEDNLSLIIAPGVPPSAIA